MTVQVAQEREPEMALGGRKDMGHALRISTSVRGKEAGLGRDRGWAVLDHRPTNGSADPTGSSGAGAILHNGAKSEPYYPPATTQWMEAAPRRSQGAGPWQRQPSGVMAARGWWRSALGCQQSTLQKLRGPWSGNWPRAHRVQHNL